MVKARVIDKYAIGGAIAAIFYVEPFDTVDLDIFFAVQAQSQSLMLTPLYDYLAGLGYYPQGQFVYIEGWPVQFLPAYNPLTDEAIQKARSIKFNRTPTRVMRAEHLVAIMLDTGRMKDYARINMFLEQGAVDLDKLTEVLKEHRLITKWKEYQRKYQR